MFLANTARAVRHQLYFLFRTECYRPLFHLVPSVVNRRDRTRYSNTSAIRNNSSWKLGQSSGALICFMSRIVICIFSAARPFGYSRPGQPPCSRCTNSLVQNRLRGCGSERRLMRQNDCRFQSFAARSFLRHHRTCFEKVLIYPSVYFRVMIRQHVGYLMTAICIVEAPSPAAMRIAQTFSPNLLNFYTA